MQDWLWASAADLGRGIAAGKIDPVDLCDVYLAAIDAHPMRDRIYARVTADRARAEARAAAARAKSGRRLSALDGVPVSWKDLFDTAGTATEAGTQLMAGRVPQSDAIVLRNATAAGLVCLGKTHLTEIAFSGLGYNPMTATPPNRHNPDAAAGGSSSGAAASVAFGLAAAGIGTDTGGSVRIPAAWNDLVGFKTTHGWLPTGGVVALCPTFDSVGPLCRTVEDAALLTTIMAGERPADLSRADMSGSRLMILDTIAMEDLTDIQRAAFTSAKERLQDAGAEVVHSTFADLPKAFQLAGPLYTADAYAQWRGLLEANPDKMFRLIRDRIRPGKYVAAVDYIAAWSELTCMRAGFAALIADVDAVIMPTTPNMPPMVADLEADDALYVSENLAALRNTRIGNLMGLCAVTLPTGLPSAGIMLCAAGGHDRALMRLAAAAESALS